MSEDEGRLPTTREAELTVELVKLRQAHEALQAECELLRRGDTERYVELVTLNNKFNALQQRGRAPTHKQHWLAVFAAGAHGGFLRWGTAKQRWDRAEALYAEGVRRGHLPKDEA